MKPYKKPLLATSLFLAVLLLLALGPSKASAANPIFATLAEVQQLITSALSPLQNSIQGLTTRVNNLETTVTPMPGQITNLQNHQNQIDQSISSLQASLSAQSNQSKAVKVFDANGQELGILLGGDLDHNVQIFIPSVNKIANINDSQIVSTTIEFTTDDCTGTEYIGINSSLGASNKVFSTPDGSFYSTDSTSVSTVRTMRSDKEWNSTTKSFSCYTFGFDSNTVSVPALPITLPFTEPFATPFHLKYQ